MFHRRVKIHLVSRRTCLFAHHYSLNISWELAGKWSFRICILKKQSPIAFPALLSKASANKCILIRSLHTNEPPIKTLRATLVLSLPIEILKVKYMCVVIGTFETSFSHGKLPELLPANAAWQVQKGEIWVWMLHYQHGFTQVTEFWLSVNHAHLWSHRNQKALSSRHQPVQINDYPSWAICGKANSVPILLAQKRRWDLQLLQHSTETEQCIWGRR